MSVRKIREVLRLKWACGLSNRAVAASCRISSSSVSEYVSRAKAAGLSWPLPDDLDEAALMAKLFPEPQRPTDGAIPVPDWSVVHGELKRKGVTRQLLWQEYREAHPDGYGYSQFCEHYRRWRAQLHPTMRQTHAAGTAMVDYAGLTVPVVDPETGELREAQIFVHCLAVSHYIYAEAQWSQDLPNWIGGHTRAHQDLRGVPPLTVNDNLKAGVTHPCRYEPDLNKTYHDFAVHCGTAVVPARVAKPRDKAPAETAVQIVERDVLAPLRDRDFIGLAELNRAIAERLHLVNHRPLRHVEQSRHQLLETIDRPALLPLPEQPFELADWKPAKVAIDYHVEFDHHFYSVPHPLIGQPVDIRATATVVEVFAAGRRVASHRRSYQRGRHTTDPAHMPEGHRAYAEWTPERFQTWAARIGAETSQVVRGLLDGRAHPQQAFRSCLGVLRLADRYSPERLEAACRQALTLGAVRYKSIKLILDAGLDLPPSETVPADPRPAHANVRGADYFH
jgi:transposase